MSHPHATVVAKTLYLLARKGIQEKIEKVYADARIYSHRKRRKLI